MTVEQRNKWLIENEKFIHKVCQPYRYRYDYEDIIQEAFVGAATALDRADESKGDKALRGFVAQYIEGYVKNNVIKKTCTLHIPRYAWDSGVRFTTISIDWEYEGEDTYESLYLPYEETGYEEAELMTDFRSAISKLPEKVQKTALMLVEGYERKDIAEAEGCSKQNINLRVRQIEKVYRPQYV